MQLCNQFHLQRMKYYICTMRRRLYVSNNDLIEIYHLIITKNLYSSSFEIWFTKYISSFLILFIHCILFSASVFSLSLKLILFVPLYKFHCIHHIIWIFSYAFGFYAFLFIHLILYISLYTSPSIHFSLYISFYTFRFIHLNLWIYKNRLEKLLWVLCIAKPKNKMDDKMKQISITHLKLIIFIFSNSK